MIFTLVYTIIALGIIWAMMKFKHRNDPPGPTGLPFLGVAHKIDPKGLHYSVTEWSEKHGNVIKFKIFGEDYVAFNSYDTIYEALVLRSREFAGRPPFFRAKIMVGGRDDIIFGSFSPKWTYLKKLAMQTLKMYGSNLLVLQEISLELIKDMIEELNLVAESGEPIPIRPFLHRCTTSIITSLLYGRKMEDNVISEWLKVEEIWDKTYTNSASGLLLDTFPWTRHLHISDQYYKLRSIHERVKYIIMDEVEKSKKNYVSGECKCFIDGIFEQLKLDEGKPNEGKITEDDLFPMMENMTAAGTITTSLTLTALVACLVNKPDIQQKLADEIKAVIGDRPPTLDDKSSLPFIEATLLEILRFHTLVPLNLPHTTTTKLQIGGYDVEQGTLVFFNLWKLHHDPEFWNDPFDFKPERFIENGMVVAADHPNRKRLMAFGAGRRVCPGEVLAKNRLFLMVTSLLQHFEFLPESEDERPSHDPRTYTLGFNLVPKPYKVRLSKRI